MKKFILILLLAVFGDSIHARTFGSSSKVKLNSSLDQDVCENIQPDEIEEVVHQLNLVNEVDMRDSYEIILLLSNDFNNTIKLFQHIGATSNGDLDDLLYENPNGEYLKRSKESIFQFKETETVYHVYPGMNGIENEVFAKFVTYKILEKAHHVKIVLIDMNPAPWNSNIPFDPKSKAGTELKKLIQNAGKIIPQVRQFNGSIGLLRMDSDFKDLSYFVYEFDNNDNIMGCNKCVKLDIFPKLNHDSLMKRKTFIPSESHGNFHDVFNKVVRWSISQTVISMREKHLDFTFSENQKLTRTMKCVEKKVEENLISDVATVTQLIKTYYSELSKDFTRAENLLEKLKESDLPFSLKDALVKDENEFNSYVDIMRKSFKYLEIKSMDEILSRIERQIESLNFLRSGRNMKMHAFQLLNPVVHLYENTILKSILLYQELFYLYEDTVYYKPDDLGEILDLNNFIENILGSETKCVPMENVYSDGKNKRIYKLQLRGSIVRFSDIPDISTDLCGGDIKFIEVFAQDSIYIDKDFNSMGNSLQFVTIAPRLWVIGERTINLTGADGKEHENPTAETGETGGKGDDGLAGLPGEPGGIFFGLSKEVINEKKLQIFANGGKGGKGQKGGEGGAPLTPRSVDTSNVNDSDIIKLFVDRETTLIPLCYYSLQNAEYGGDGGNGGIGGQKGKPGKISLYKLDKNSSISEIEAMYSAEEGDVGESADAGKGVEGLISAAETKFSVYCPKRNIYGNGLHSGDYLTIREPKPKNGWRSSMRGKDGSPGASHEGEKLAVEFESFSGIASIVNTYKKFIRPHLDTSDKAGVVTEFYEELINNKAVNEEYETLEFLDELKGLEEQYMDLMGMMDMTFMYENLCKRIEDYARRREGREKSEDFTIALGYAYTAALSKINRIQGTGNYKLSFIVNIKKYLDSVINNLSELKRDTVQYAANREGEKYQQELEQKIQEAKFLIETQLREELQKTEKLLKKKLYKLFLEVRDLKEETRLKKKDLAGEMAQQSILGVLKSVLVLGSLLIPGGKMAVTVAFTGLQIAETFLDKDVKEKHTTKIPESIGTNLKGGLEFVKKSKQKELEDLERQRKILNYEKQKLQFYNNGSSIDPERIKEELKRLEDQIENSSVEDSGQTINVTSGFEIVSKLNTYIVHRSWNYAMTDDLVATDGRVKELAKDLEEADTELIKIQKYQNRIYEEFEPVFDCMFRDLPSDATLNGQSLAALDISKWRVQGALREVKNIVKKFTEGFEVADEMNQLTKTVEETMNTLIGIYDQIQNYQKDMRLVTYFNKVLNSDIEHLHASNAALEKAVLETRMIIKKNVAMIQYERVFKAFKQFVFPFARDYLNETSKPSSLELHHSDDIATLLIDVSNKVNNIKNMVVDIEENDLKHNRQTSTFDRNNEQHKGIHVWKNETYNELISNVLDGKEVTLYLDPRPFRHYAVKFRKIKLGFIAKDEKYQSNLDEKLQLLSFNMTHMGNSYYTCGNKMYLISHEEIELGLQSFNGKSQSTNVRKIAKGDGSASPFATWRVKLSGFYGDMEKNYLADFKNKVDLIFEGDVEYVVIGSTDVCSNGTDLSEYYQEYDSMLDVPVMKPSQ